MSEYVAALCQMSEGELVPLETLNITADNDDDAIRKAVEWRTSTISAIDIDQKTWLQVLRDGKAIHSQGIGRF